MNQLFMPCLLGAKSLILFAGRFDYSPGTMRRGSMPLSQEQWLMIFVGAVLVFVLAIALPRLYLMWLHARVNSPQILFMQLCKAHELERDSILLLQELAVCRQLVNPSQLFVDPRYFQPNGLSDTLSQRHQDLISLQQLLFSTAV